MFRQSSYNAKALMRSCLIIQLERVALSGDPRAFSFVVPMINQKNCDFSFSGLKSQVIREVHARGGVSGLGPQGVADVAASFQFAAVQHLQDRIDRALKWCRINGQPTKTARSLVICGCD